MEKESIKGEVQINLFEKREELRFIAKCIRELKTELRETESSLSKKVHEYNEHLVLAFVEILSEQGLAWCNDCETAQPNQDFELLLLKRQEYYEHGYGNSFYGYRDFSKLHYCCPNCANEYHIRHGYQKPNDQAYTCAYSVAETADGLAADINGKKQELDRDKYKIPLPKIYDIGELMAQMNLPPQLHLDSHNYQNPTMVRNLSETE